MSLSHVSPNDTSKKVAHKKNTLAHIPRPETSIKQMINSDTFYAQTRPYCTESEVNLSRRRISRGNITKQPGGRTNSVIKKVRSFSGPPRQIVHVKKMSRSGYHFTDDARFSRNQNGTDPPPCGLSFRTITHRLSCTLSNTVSHFIKPLTAGRWTRELFRSMRCGCLNLKKKK